MNRLKWYKTHYTDLFEPLHRLSLHGLQYDVVRGEQTAKELAERCATLKREVAELAGEPLHSVKTFKHRKANKPLVEEGKSISAAKLKVYLYDRLKLPARHKDGKVTTNEAALRSLRLTYPDRCGAVIDKVLEFRRFEKLGSFISEGKCDADGRVRAAWKANGTMTGRLSSSSNPRGTGMNLQNIDRELRHLFLPDEGCIFLEVDLHMAEWGVLSALVAATTGDRSMLEMYQRGDDVYRLTAENIYKSKEISKQQRQRGKVTVLAGGYGMQAKRHAQNALLDGIYITEAEAQVEMNAYMDLCPGVLKWQKVMRLELLRTHKIVNSWGREIDFSANRITDDEVRRMFYAAQPQSEIGDLCNQYMFIPLDRYIQLRVLRSHINLQAHDAVIVSAVPQEVYEIASFLNTSLMRPRKYRGIELVITPEFVVSTDWGKAKKAEWKKLPSQDEMENAVAKLMN